MYHLNILNVEILEGKILLWLESARFVKNKPGVYVFYDKKLNVLYIGQSDSLQKEFEKYVDTDFENYECKQKTHTYQRLFTENPKVRIRQLLEDYKKEYGNVPTCNAESDLVDV